MNKYGLALALTVFGWQASVFAWVRPQSANDRSYPSKQKTQQPCEEESPSNFEFGGDYTHVDLHPKDSSYFSGSLGGAQGIYEYKAKNKIYGAARLAWKQGSTDGSAGHRFLRYIDTQERLGYSFGSQRRERILTLFSGLGFRYLGHKLTPRKGDSLRINYSEFYVPVGFITYGNLSSRFTLGGGFTWMPQIFPTVTIVPLKGSHWSLTNRLNNFYGELIFDFALNRKKTVHLIFYPFYERWQDGHTTAKTKSGIKLGLPGNTYTFWGIDMNLAFYF